MKTSLRILGIILIGLFLGFTVGCGQDDDNVEPEEAGNYTLVSATILGFKLEAPEYIRGKLHLNNGSSWTIVLNDEKYVGDDWDPVTNILYDNSDRIPYTYDEGILHLTLTDEDNTEVHLVWEKD